MSVVKIDTDKYPTIASRYGIKVRAANLSSDAPSLQPLLAI